MAAAIKLPLACFICAAWLLFSSASLRAAEPILGSKPNIVLFLADDLGWADVTWHGGQARTPHLDKLAAEGVKLEAHYVHAMCSPTRAALLTGRYASRFGVTAAQNERALPWNTMTLAGALKSAGYDTALVGKWHLGSKPEEGPQKFGWDFGYGSLAGGCGPLDHRYKQGPFTYTWHRDGQLVDEPGHVTDLLARESVRWLEQRGERPFLLYVPFTAIHVPIREEDKWLQMNAHIADPGRRLRAACQSHMDDCIGQVLAALERKKLRERTLVLFLCDNGAHPPGPNQGGAYPGDYGDLRVGNDNLPLRGHKSGVYEGGVRTPAIAHWPGMLSTGEIHTPLHAVDWLPTLCALAGVETQADWKLDGANIWNVVTREAKSLPARAIYSAAPNFRAQMVRYGDWKLVVTKGENQGKAGAGATEELFNLAQDLSETKDLAKAEPAVLAQMRQRLADVAARDKDAAVTGER